MVCGYFYPWTLRNGKFYSYYLWREQDRSHYNTAMKQKVNAKTIYIQMCLTHGSFG